MNTLILYKVYLVSQLAFSLKRIWRKTKHLMLFFFKSITHTYTQQEDVKVSCSVADRMQQHVRSRLISVCVCRLHQAKHVGWNNRKTPHILFSPPLFPFTSLVPPPPIFLFHPLSLPVTSSLHFLSSSLLCFQ